MPDCIFYGTCYKGGNWIHLGATQGRGRMDREYAAHGQAIKDIFVYPLCRHAREQFRTTASPIFIDREEENTVL